MALDPRTPVIVGVGQFLWRAQGLEDAMEPIALMEQAVRNAVGDAGLAAVPPAVGSIRVINSLSWRYGDPAALLAAAPRHHGGGARRHAPPVATCPQSIVNRTALDIAAGLDLAVIVGGEAWRTRTRAQAGGARLDWDTSARDRPPPVVLGDELAMSHPAEAARGVLLPVQVYPMFETAVRAAAGRRSAAHRRHIAALWSRFSAVAASNDHAWSRGALTADEIPTPSPRPTG